MLNYCAPPLVSRFLACSCFSQSCAAVCAPRHRHQLFPLIASVLRGVLRPSQSLSMDALASHALLDPTKPGCVLTASRGWAERSSVALPVPQVRLFSACAASFLPGLSTPPLGVSKGSWLTGGRHTRVMRAARQPCLWAAGESCR